MKSWQRWITLATLTLMALGPGLFWSPTSAKAGTGFSQGWTVVPLPQQLVEAKSKLNTVGSGLIALALGLASCNLHISIHSQARVYQAPIHHQRLYLIYSRLQTDGA